MNNNNKNINSTGYRTGNSTSNNNYNIIPSNRISMKGVKTKLRLVPIVAGVPQYNRAQEAVPDQEDIIFPSDVEAVMEVPMAQSGLMTTNPYLILNNTNFNMLDGIPNLITDYRPSSGSNPSLMGNLPYHYVPSSVPTNTQTNTTATTTTTNTSQSETEKPAWSQIQYANPYAGYDLNSAAYMFGQSLAFDTNDILGENSSLEARRTARAGNLGRMVGSIGKMATAGLGNVLAGMGTQNMMNEAMSTYYENLRKNKMNQQTSYRKGGNVFLKQGGVTPGMQLSGEYIFEEGAPNPNVEIEGGEYVQHPDGKVQEAFGNKHSQGGMLVEYEGRVISDHMRMGGTFAKKLRNEYDIKVDAKNTYSDAIDKYKAKTGLKKKLKEKENLINNLESQQEVEDENTRMVNITHLQNSIHDLEQEILPLEEDLQVFTNLVYTHQEMMKPEEERDPQITEQIQGENTHQGQQGPQMSPEEVITSFAYMQGVDPQQVMQHFQQLDEAQQNEALQQMAMQLQQLNAQPSPEQQQGSPMMQEGGEAVSQEQQIQQLIMMFSQITGVPPEEVVAQLQQATPEQQQQLIEEMIMIVQQASQQGQQPQDPSMGQQPQDPQMMLQDGGLVNQYNIIKERHKKARQAIGKNDKKTLAELGSVDTPYSNVDLIKDFNELQRLRKLLGYGVGEEAGLVFPHVGQQIRGTVNSWLGTSLQEGGNVAPSAQADQQIQQIVMMFSEVTGVPPEEIIAQLQQATPEQQQQMVLEMVQVIEQASSQQQPAPQQAQPQGNMQQDPAMGQEPQMMQSGGSNKNYQIRFNRERGSFELRGPQGHIRDITYEEAMEAYHTGYRAVTGSGSRTNPYRSLGNRTFSFTKNQVERSIGIDEPKQSNQNTQQQNAPLPINIPPLPSTPAPTQAPLPINIPPLPPTATQAPTPAPATTPAQTQAPTQAPTQAQAPVAATTQSSASTPAQSTPTRGGRTTEIYNPDYGFVLLNEGDSYSEYGLQSAGPSGVFGGADIQRGQDFYSRFGRGWFDQYYEEGEDGNYQLRDGMTVRDFQLGYNDYINNSVEYLRSLGEYSEEELQDFLDNTLFLTEGTNTSRLADGKWGNVTNTRPVVQRNIVPEELLTKLHEEGLYTGRDLLGDNSEKAKEILGEELYNEAVRGLDQYENANYALAAKTQADVDAPVATTEDTVENTVPDYTEDDVPTRTGLLQFPDQRMPAPYGLQTGDMGSVRFEAASPTYVSPEAQLNAINRQLAPIFSQLDSRPDSQRAATLASMIGTTSDSVNNVYAQTQMANQQAQAQANQFNLSQSAQEQQTNNQYAGMYDMQTLTALGNTQGDMQRFIKYNNDLNASRFNTVKNTNASNALNPNFQIMPDGRVLQNNDDFVFTHQGQQYIKRKDGTVELVDPNNTNTVPTQKLYGGTVYNSFQIPNRDNSVFVQMQDGGVVEIDMRNVRETVKPAKAKSLTMRDFLKK